MLTPNKVPARVLTESNGNHFFRMTVSPEDCGSTVSPPFYAICPKIRAELRIGSTPQPYVGQTVTYSFRHRIPASGNPVSKHRLWWQLFQHAGLTPHGRTVWLGSTNGRLFVAVDTGRTEQEDFDSRELDLGPIRYDVWTDYSFVVHLSDTSSGRVDVYRNGSLAGSITGQPTVKARGATTYYYLNIVDFDGVRGTADYDDLKEFTGGAPPPPPL